jgi:hypothetical protein
MAKRKQRIKWLKERKQTIKWLKENRQYNGSVFF